MMVHNTMVDGLGPGHATGVVASGLSKRFGDQVALNEVDLTVPAGSMLALLGPNGAGKTTAVRILTTLLRPDAGAASVGGFDLTQPDRVRAVIGLTGQDTSVDGLLTGRENLIMIGRLRGLRLSAARSRAGELLEQFDLVGVAERVVKTYSGGLRRRLDLAASVVSTPAVLFLDEPTTGLDPRAREEMWKVIRRLMGRGTAVLLTTQYLEEADGLADRIAVIDEGRIIAEGSPEELKQQVGTERAQLTFATGEELEAARSLLDSPDLIVSEETRRLEMSLDGPWEFKAILDRLHQAGITPGGLRVVEPTLNDVFFSLTGSPRQDVEVVRP